MHDPDDWFSVTEAATYLKLKGASGVRSLVARGRLKPDGRGPRRQHMFRRRTLDAFLEAGAVRWHPREETIAAAPSAIRRPRFKIDKFLSARQIVKDFEERERERRRRGQP